MTVHPRRAVMELFHLKRVHVLVPNDKLADALRAKLSTLQILPEQLTEKSLECLLDSLAYFKLTSVPAAVAAIHKARELLPTLKGHTLAAIVGNCSKLEEHSIALQCAPLLHEAIKTMSAEDVASLASSFHRAGLASPERWAFLAEHVIRNIQQFIAADLVQIVAAMTKQKIDYPDLFAVIERHVTEQPAAYISGVELAELIEGFRRANYPVVSLVALSTERSTLGLDAGIDSMTGNTDPNSPVAQAFLASSQRAIAEASLQSVTETLQRCEERRVFQWAVLLSACQRVEQLRCTTELEPSGLFAFLQAALLVAKGASATTEKQDPTCAESKGACGMHIIQLADLCSPLVRLDLHRSVTFIYSYLRLFTKPHSSEFAKVLINHCLQYDSMELQECNQLLRFCFVMDTFAALGGRRVLAKNLSMIAVGASRMNTSQLSTMAETLSHVPEAAGPSGELFHVLQVLSSTKGWRNAIKPADVLRLLRAMTTSRVRHNQVVVELVAVALQHHGMFSPEDLSRAMLYAAQLNFKELNFYTVSASRVYLHPSSTVTDVCRVLFALTHVVSYVIKVVQDALPRLRIGSGRAAPRDITLALYSFVKLRVTRHEDITRALCDQAAATVGRFKPQELLSVLQSLRQLGVSHTVLFEAFAARVAKERDSMAKDVYVAIIAALAVSSRGVLDEATKAEFIGGHLNRMDDMSTAELRDVLVAVSKFYDASTERMSSASGLSARLRSTRISDEDAQRMIAAAESRADELAKSVTSLSDVIVALTDIKFDAVSKESPLAEKLRGMSMEFMELPKYHEEFRNRGLFRLFPETPAAGSAALSSGAPGNIFSAARDRAAPAAERTIGEKLKVLHDEQKAKSSRRKSAIAAAASKRRR